LFRSGPRWKREKPARSKSTGFPVVVEVRRLELLTPYMRRKSDGNAVAIWADGTMRKSGNDEVRCVASGPPTFAEERHRTQRLS
jgi:hypothetical protein